MSIEATLCCGSAGWYVEWFEEDASAPLGYLTAHWYGSRDACVERMSQPAPALLPARERSEPDAATATGMYDY
jgi:hypothetical protein